MAFWKYFCLFLYVFALAYCADIKKHHNVHHEDYTHRQKVRRQQVIHPINENESSSVKNDNDNDEDIESLGKRIDATGAEISKPKHENSKETVVATKAIIAKIKEIQDKIFKRTNGNKNLEAELQLMSPIPAQKNVESSPLVKKKPVDVSGDRRKIIPEDVVDKILEKFQQLRTEAKHIAIASADDPNKKHEGAAPSPNVIPAELTENNSPGNPYASIGPPKESEEIANRTSNADVKSVGLEPQSPSTSLHDAVSNTAGQIQIPIGNTASAGNSPSIPNVDGKSPKGIPIMFIKNGPNLIPVYNNGENGGTLNSPISASGQGAVQFNNNPLPEPNLPTNVVPMMNEFNGGERGENPESRCDIPGSCPNPGEGGSNDLEQHISPERVSDTQMTGDLIDKLIHSPGFPQLASKLISEGKINYPEQEGGERMMDGMGDSRNVVPMTDSNVEGMDHSKVNFDMKGSYASANLPEPSMAREEQQRREEEERHHQDVENFFEHQPASKSDVSTNMLNNRAEGRSTHGLDGRYVNDISDPMEDVESKFGSKSADELLDFAKYRSMSAPDLHSSPNSQVGMQPDENAMVAAHSPQQRVMNPFPQEGASQTEDAGQTIASRFMNEDPSALLDDLHKTQMQQGLTGPGDSAVSIGARGSFGLAPDQQQQAEGEGRHRIPEPAPDDLLQQVRNFNHRMDVEQIQHRQRIEAEKKNLNRDFGYMDPSVADEIRGNNGLSQKFDVERKDLATENDMQLLRSRSPSEPRRHGQISVMSGDTVQFNSGRLSMDTNDVLSSYREGAFSRNKIGRPRRRHKRHHKRRFLHPFTRGIIEHPMSLNDNDVELRVNGQTLKDNTQLRSTIVDGKVRPGKGKTFTSKDPIQIELSHDDQKRKIVNIVTKGKYRVMNDKKRFQIPHKSN
ncbi:uncharacterized protein [Clytia hemisphaerica]|uniref:Uncharacterized protein n=1 Tax=Clytia hemisphaerica TaxID=252671 RepID=A0A7M5XK03_9CNID